MIPLFLAPPVALPLSPARLSLLPDLPSPLRMRDWRSVARGFDRRVYEDGSSPYGPLAWSDPDHPGGFGVVSYVGGAHKAPDDHEAITVMGSLLGGTLVGVDHADRLVGATQYFRPEDGVVLNRTTARSGETFWYDIFPGIVFAQLSDCYPQWAEGRRLARLQAEKWGGAVRAMSGNFEHTGFDLRVMKPKDNGRWIEPDAAAGLAYLELAAAKTSDDKAARAAAKSALDALEARETNPTYELLTSFGALAAARSNAEDGSTYDVARLLDWSLEPSPNRTGWGTVVGRWGGLDVGGLAGSTTDGGGYAFAMNTFVLAGNLAPLARYDDRFSADVAKILLNAANAARLLYGVDLDPAHQSFDHAAFDPERTIPYEGLRRGYAGVSPRAMGDPTVQGWAKTDLCLYAGGYAGLLGAIVRPTDVPEIPRFDLRATDFFSRGSNGGGFPTSLLRNPFDAPRRVTLDLGSKPVRLWDAVANRVIAPRAMGAYALSLKPKQTVQIVTLPVGGEIRRGLRVATLGGRVVDFNAGSVPLPPRRTRRVRDESVEIPALRGTKFVDGRTEDWGGVPVAATLDTGGRGKARADLRLAWDDRYLYVLVRQTAMAQEIREAPDAEALHDRPWTLEDVGLTLDLARRREGSGGAPPFATAGDVQVTLGWASEPKPGIIVSPSLPESGLSVAASGSAARGDRVLEARIAWRELFVSATNGARDGSGFVRPGYRFGLQPLLVDGTHERQSWIGGGQYVAPTGYDRNSRTVVLK